MILHHATRRSNLDSIMADGLRTAHYGRVHGKMDYAPAGPSVYLASEAFMGNLNAALFDDPDDPVISISVDGSRLNPELFYPDDALMYFVDELLEDDEVTEEAVKEFSREFGLDPQKAERLLSACLNAASEKEYPGILREMWPEYLATQKDVAYLGDIGPGLIIGWREHPGPDEPDPEP